MFIMRKSTSLLTLTQALTLYSPAYQYFLLSSDSLKFTSFLKCFAYRLTPWLS